MNTGTRHIQVPAGGHWLNRHDRCPPGLARAWRGAATGDDSNDRVAQDLLHNWANHLFGEASSPPERGQ